MSTSQVVIDTLIKKRDQIIIERNKIVKELNGQLGEIEDALDQLSGKYVWRPEKKELYDDENPVYITGTEDGI